MVVSHSNQLLQTKYPSKARFVSLYHQESSKNKKFSHSIQLKMRSYLNKLRNMVPKISRKMISIVIIQLKWVHPTSTNCKVYSKGFLLWPTPTARSWLIKVLWIILKSRSMELTVLETANLALRNLKAHFLRSLKNHVRILLICWSKCCNSTPKTDRPPANASSTKPSTKSEWPSSSKEQPSYSIERNTSYGVF